MRHIKAAYNTFLAAVIGCYATFATPVVADEVADLLARLQTAEPVEAQRLGNEVLDRWSRSGSSAMDHLLRRGRKALEDGDTQAALDHLTALTDHAPDFAEGWATRATAFLMLEKFGLAMADLERALALNPDHFVALAAVGAVLERVGQPDAAVQALEAALAIHPHLPQVTEALDRVGRKTKGTDL